MPPVLDQRYELGAPLGSGGMADVFEGYDRTLDRRVAVKLLKTDLADPRARERFAREARTAAAFTHPNAVTVYDVGDDGRRPFIVMELVEGSDLAELLAARGPFPPRQAARIADQMLAALGAAHAEGLVHRDVKPGNVLVARDGAVKLTDFGIAKAASDATAGLTATGQVVGTPRYLAPEQAAGKAATPRSDLYAAGVVLYEMLAGEPPFTGDSAIAIALAHQQAPVPSLADRRPGIPPALVATVGHALEKEPERRFPDADGMRVALRGAPGVTAPTAVMPAPPPGPARAARRPRRSRWWVPLAVAALFAAGAGLGFLLLDRGNDSPAPVVDTDPTTTAAPTTTAPPTTTTAPPTTTPPPQTIGALVGLLAENPGAFGEKAPDLRDKLIGLGDDPDPKKAADLIEEVDKWVEEGELDPEIGAAARAVLAPMASAADGDGRGRGGDRDDDD